MLGPRALGLRKHFTIPESKWPAVRNEFAALLHQENRPISTIEAIDRQRLAAVEQANSYEVAEIIRDDRRSIDLGRKLFGLTEWGIQERQHINDLLPRVFKEAKHVLTIQQALTRMTRLRSVSPNSIANALQKHPGLRSFGFGYYGLTSWSKKETQVMLTDRTTIERAVRRSTPPVTFKGLCGIFRIRDDSEEGALLWKTCASSSKLRRAPDKRTAETLLLHKVVSLELALATIARELNRPAPAYELEWEVSAKFGSLFTHIGLPQIEQRLVRNPRFVQNPAGEFLLDSQVDLEAFDVDALRAATIQALTESADIVSSNDLIERLEQRGFDVSDLSGYACVGFACDS